MSTGVIKAIMRMRRPVITYLSRLAQDYFPENKKKNRRLSSPALKTWHTIDIAPEKLPSCFVLYD
jgi:hypothetical protein